MSKYIFLYCGPVAQMQNISEEESKASMEAWGAWIGRLGPTLTDVGNPFGERVSVADDGTSPEPAGVHGYSIVEAADLDAARTLTEYHPFLSEGRGRFSVDIFELVPV